MTYCSALGSNVRHCLLARAIQFFTPGIPMVYYVGLFAGLNDYDVSLPLSAPHILPRASFFPAGYSLLQHVLPSMCQECGKHVSSCAACLIQFFMHGIPMVYHCGLFAGLNDCGMSLPPLCCVFAVLLLCWANVYGVRVQFLCHLFVLERSSPVT